MQLMQPGAVTALGVFTPQPASQPASQATLGDKPWLVLPCTALACRLSGSDADAAWERALAAQRDGAEGAAGLPPPLDPQVGLT